ncbi:hypothetical protein Tco_0064811 [Tanacetum coccineum]
MKETPYELLKDDQKKQLGKNNDANMTLYNALPRKEYERVFMYKTAKEVWYTLIITHQGNSQVKNCKIDLLTQEYEKFSISSEETIDSGFTRFNAITTSLKSLDPDYSSKNHVRKFLRALPIKWIAKFDICKKKSKGGESSRRQRGCYNCGNKNHFIDDFPKSKRNKAFFGGSWSDSDDGNKPQNNATCLMAFESQEVLSKPSSSNNDLDIIDLQKENEELVKFSKDFSKTNEKLLQEKIALEKEHSKLFSKVIELELEV